VSYCWVLGVCSVRAVRVGFFFLFVGEIVDFLYWMDGLRKLLTGGYARFFDVVEGVYRVMQ
jgi:hypothetical protein